jgi:hypothetical protein
MVEHREPVEIVLAWHAALNAGNVEELLGLSTSDVEVGGPRGVGRGADLLRDWVARAQIRLEPVRWQADGPRVVVEESATWLGPDGQPTPPQDAASVFAVEDDRVASVIRHADFGAALEAARVAPPPSA